MKKIVLIGAGGHCKSVLDSLVRSGEFKEIAVTDSNLKKGSQILGYEIIGCDDELQGLYDRGYQYAFVSIGSIKDTSLRHRLYGRALGIGFDFPDIIDPTAVIGGGFQIGNGVFIGKKAVINTDCRIGEMAVINTGAVVEHECTVGKFAHISVGAAVCGGCEIGNDVFVGANATIIQGVKIGMNSIIGAGSVVLKDVPDHTTITGVWGGIV